MCQNRWSLWIQLQNWVQKWTSLIVNLSFIWRLKSLLNNFWCVRLPIRPTLCVIGTHTYSIAKFLAAIYNYLTTNEFIFKDYFSFTKKLLNKAVFYNMGSADVRSLFTNIPHKENISIFTELIYNQNDTVEGLTVKVKQYCWRLKDELLQMHFFVFLKMILEQCFDWSRPIF